MECSGSPVGHVLGITRDQKLVRDVLDFKGSSSFRLKPSADARLEMSNGTSSHNYDGAIAPGCPAGARELFRRAGQVGVRPHSQACMWSYRESSVVVVCERPRVGFCNGVVALVLFSFVLLGVVPGGRRQRAAGPWNPPTLARGVGRR